MASEYGWMLGALLFGVAAVLWACSGGGERGAIRRDLAKRGCVLRHAAWLPGRRGLLEHMGYDWLWGNTVWYGSAYEVSYTNRDGTPQVAVCMMGPGGLVFWTDEHPEPGFDRHGNPPNLPDHGQNWRG